MIRWVPSQAQLADAFTKCMDASVLRECMERGRYSLHDEAQILRARSDSRARLQWLRMMSSDSKGDGNSISRLPFSEKFYAVFFLLFAAFLYI